VTTRRPATATPSAAKSKATVIVLALLAESAFLVLVGTQGSSRLLLGIPGSGVALVVIVAAIFAGPLAGIAVALVGGIGFYVFVADLGAASSLFGTLAGTLIWCAAAVITGFIAESLTAQRRRGQRIAGRLDRESHLRQAIDRLLEQSRGLGSGDLTAVAAEICRATRATLGCDWARLYLASGDSLRLVGGEPQMALLPLGSSYPLAGVDVGLLSRRGPIFATDLDSLGLPPALLASARQLAVGSTLIAPLLVGGLVKGLLACSWRKILDEEGDEFLGVAQRLADQASAALENARRREAQNELAALHEILERSLVPPAFVEHPDLTIITRYRPAEGRLRLGGDFLDVMSLPRRGLALIIGDVSGHGPAAAALGATLRATWQGLVMSGADRATIRATLDATMIRERRDEDTFATACLAWIDRVGGRDRLHFLNIGHPLPLLVNDEVVPLAAPPSLPMGVGGEARWDPVIITLTPPWSLFFYTDGLVEGPAALDSPDRFGEEGLVARLNGHRAIDEAAVDALLAHIQAANGGPMKDDVALVVVSPRS
jgi:serine phosphatase RsbU (regulator of sigma subunit)